MQIMKWFGAVIGIVVAVFVLFLLLHNFTPPTFRVKQVKSDGKGVRIEIRPNFVVNDIRYIKIEHSGQVLVFKKGVFVGRQALELPGEVEAGDMLTITCDLQYDRWISASIGRVEKQLVVK